MTARFLNHQQYLPENCGFQHPKCLSGCTSGTLDLHISFQHQPILKPIKWRGWEPRSLTTSLAPEKNYKIPKDRKGSLDNSSSPTSFSGGNLLLDLGKGVGCKFFLCIFFGEWGDMGDGRFTEWRNNGDVYMFRVTFLVVANCWRSQLTFLKWSQT